MIRKLIATAAMGAVLATVAGTATPAHADEIVVAAA